MPRVSLDLRPFLLCSLIANRSHQRTQLECTLKGKFDQPITSASWEPNGSSFVLGSHDSSIPLSIWEVDSTPGADPGPVFRFGSDCPRVHDCAVYQTGTHDVLASSQTLPGASNAQGNFVRIVVAGEDKSVHVFDYYQHHKVAYISLDAEINCLSLSVTRPEILVNLRGGEVWSLDMATGTVQHKFRGQEQTEYVVRSCYGGASEGFVLSGGEGPFLVSNKVTH